LKTHPVAAKLFHVDGQTERDRQADTVELIVTFCDFASKSNLVHLLGPLVDGQEIPSSLQVSCC